MFTMAYYDSELNVFNIGSNAQARRQAMMPDKDPSPLSEILESLGITCL